VRNRLIPWAILLVSALAYPLALTAANGPRFPSPAECIHPARSEGKIQAVFGRFSSYAHAAPVLKHALALGFKGTQIESDGCGFLKVVVHGIPTLQVGRDFVAEARGEGFNPRLEQEGP
jgi:hypothetical protein